MKGSNHKLLQQRLNDKRSQITDEQFFTSRLLAGHFEDVAAVQTRRYKYNRRVRVHLDWNPQNQDTAHTDNEQVYINAGSGLVSSIEGRLNRYRIVFGLFSHELGHILHTDFLLTQRYINAMLVSQWYPGNPKTTKKKEREALTEIWEYAKEDVLNLRAVVEVAKDILNVIEDGYIEIKMLNEYQGKLGQSLKALREHQQSRMHTVTQLKEAERAGQRLTWNTIRDCILSYVKFGEIKYGDEPLEDERIQTVFKLLSLLDDALFSKNIKERFNVTNIVLVRCWEHIKAYCEVLKERYKQEAENPTEEGMSEFVSGNLSKMSGGSKMGKGKTKPVESQTTPKENKKTASKREKTRKQAGLDKDKSSAEDDASANEGGVPAEEAQAESKERRGATDEEGGRIPQHYTDSVSVPEDGGVERDDNFEENPCDKAAEDIAHILEKMASEKASEELEEERLQELNDMAQNISYGDVHQGVHIAINRVAKVNDAHIREYEAVAQPLLTISKRLQRSISQKLEDSRRNEKLSGLISGRRLSSHALYRQDCKMFYKNKLPSETELAVGLLIDESGSMDCNQRCTYARATAIILEDFCRKLGIPIAVYGHSTGYRGSERNWKRSVELYSYVEFDNFDNDDRYRLMNISSRGGNRDGAALRFVAERLMERPEPQKLLMLISDGQPADSGYSGDAAEADLRGIQQEYQRKGVLFLAAAIGDDKENIQRIYGDAFLDITDLEQLPVKLTNEVKRYIRV